MKVLIADDSLEIRERLVSALSGIAGVGLVGAACDTVEFVQAFHRQRPDAVVLDLKMPGGGGVSAVREIKRAQPSVFTIVLTAYPQKAYRDHCLEAGADHFLHKATEFEKVAELLRQFQEEQDDGT